MAAQVSADLSVIGAGINDHDLILIPQYGGIGISDTELDVICTRMRPWKQGDDNDRDAGQHERDPDLSGKPDDGTKTCQSKNDTKHCQPIGRRQPEGEAGDLSETADGRQQVSGQP